MKRMAYILFVLGLAASHATAAEEEVETGMAFLGRAMNQVQKPYDYTRRSAMEQYLTANKRIDFRNRGLSSIYLGWKASHRNREAVEPEGTPTPEPGKTPTPEDANKEETKMPGEAGENKEVPPTTETVDFNTYPPLQAHLMGMLGEAWAISIKSGMKGPSAKLMIALHQVEPGVAAGVTAAETIGASRLNALYDAQAQVYNSIPESGLARAIVIEEWNSCIVKEQQNGGWLNAVEKCLGDSTTAPTGAALVQEMKAEPALGADKEAETEGKQAKSVIKDLQDDYLFKVDDDESEVVKKKFAVLKKAWATWFGNYKLEFPEQAEEMVGNVRSMHPLSMKVTMPTREIQNITYDLAVKRFESAQELLINMCYHALSRGWTTPDEINKINPLNMVDTESFWSEENLRDAPNDKGWIWELSTPEVPVRAVVFDAIYDMFMLKQLRGRVFNSESDCNAIRASYGGIRENDPLFDILNILFEYGRFVAVSQVLHTFEEALRFVSTRSNILGGEDSALSQAAKELVYNVAQVRDIHEAIRYNTAEWNLFINERILDRREMEEGQAAAALVNAAK